MNNATQQPVKFTVTQDAGGFQIVGHYSSGRNLVWGTQRTERGVKSCMTQYAKRCGLNVQKAANVVDIVAA